MTRYPFSAGLTESIRIQRVCSSPPRKGIERIADCACDSSAALVFPVCLGFESTSALANEDLIFDDSTTHPDYTGCQKIAMIGEPRVASCSNGEIRANAKLARIGSSGQESPAATFKPVHVETPAPSDPDQTISAEPVFRETTGNRCTWNRCRRGGIRMAKRRLRSVKKSRLCLCYPPIPARGF
jgi:hypothetical protein